MEPIQINVKIEIGAESAFLNLLSSLSKNQDSAPAAEQTTKRKAKATAKKEPEPQPELEPEPEIQQAKTYTEVDVRAAMDRARKRIEGEDYKEKTDSPAYKKWHRTLTTWFKNAASDLGAEKPSALPNSEKREAFIARCDALHVEDGVLSEIPS